MMMRQKRLDSGLNGTAGPCPETRLLARTIRRGVHFAWAGLVSIALLGCSTEPAGSAQESQAPSRAEATVATTPELPPWKEFLKTLTEREQKMAMAAGGALLVMFFVGVGIGKSIRKGGPPPSYRHET